MRCLALASLLGFASCATLPRQLLKERREVPEGHAPFRQVLQNYKGQDLQYLAEVSVGGQRLLGILDTGSFELLVFSDQCQDCGARMQLYREAKSRTHRRGTRMAKHIYGSGATLSNEAFEEVQVGPLLVKNMSFWEVYEADMPVLQKSSFQAIIGVGPPGSNASFAAAAFQDPGANDSAQTVVAAEVSPAAEVRALLPSKTQAAAYELQRASSLVDALKVRSFSICYGAASGSPGYFVWHDNAPQHQKFARVPIAGHATWGVKLSRVHLDGHGDVGCTEGCGAIVDSGTSLLVMPRSAMEKIQATLQDSKASCDSELGVSHLPSLHFQMGGQNLSLPPSAFVGTVVGEVPKATAGWLRGSSERVLICGLELTVMTQEAETQLGPLWILGMPLFRHYYVNFDLGPRGGGDRSLRLAPADSGCRPSDTVSLLGSSGSEAARTLDAAQLRVPDWVASTYAKGQTTI